MYIQMSQGPKSMFWSGEAGCEHVSSLKLGGSGGQVLPGKFVKFELNGWKCIGNFKNVTLL